MSDDYDVLIEISAEDIKKAADAREQRDDEIERLRAELAAEQGEIAKFRAAMADVRAERDALRAERDALRDMLTYTQMAEQTALEDRDAARAERDALRARLKEVANAIEPIASLAAKFDPPQGYIDQAEWVSVAHLRRARAVYEKIKGGGGET